MSDKSSPFDNLSDLGNLSKLTMRSTKQQSDVESVDPQSQEEPVKPTTEAEPTSDLQPAPEALVPPNERTVNRTDERAIDRPLIKKRRRQKVRYAFEFYQDQIEQLKQLRKEALIRDEDFVMSEAVRRALDAFLASVDSPTDRTDERSGDR